MNEHRRMGVAVLGGLSHTQFDGNLVHRARWTTRDAVQRIDADRNRDLRRGRQDAGG